MIQLERTASTFAHMTPDPEVHSLCNQTAQMLDGMLLFDSGARNGTNGTIISEHWSDIIELDIHLSDMKANWNNQNSILGQIKNISDKVTETRSLLQQCRVTERTLCIKEEQCEKGLEECTCIWCNVTNITNDIITKYCDTDTNTVINSSTQETWYNVSTAQFASYEEAWKAANAKQKECDEKEENCTQIATNSTTQSLTCEGLEDEFQKASCQQYRTLRLTWAEYSLKYDTNVAAYRALELQVRKREADRKLEWDVLKRVICLLTVLTDPEDIGDGYLSDENSKPKIDNCWNMQVSTTHLDITYPAVPDKLAPSDQPYVPCSADFHANESLGTPDVCVFLSDSNSADSEAEGTAFRGYNYHCSCATDDLPDWTNISSTSKDYQLSFASVSGVTIDETQAQATWTLADPQTGLTCAGNIASIRPAVGNEYDVMSSAYDDATVTRLAYAYPAAPADPDFCPNFHDGLNTEQWFCCRGGMLLLDDSNGTEVLASMEILPAASGTFDDQTLGAEFALEFSTLEEVNCASFICDGGVDVKDWQFPPMRPEKATKFCWTWSWQDTPLIAFHTEESASTDMCKLARVTGGIYMHSPSQ